MPDMKMKNFISFLHLFGVVKFSAYHIGTLMRNEISINDIQKSECSIKRI